MTAAHSSLGAELKLTKKKQTADPSFGMLPLLCHLCTSPKFTSCGVLLFYRMDCCFD